MIHPVMTRVSNKRITWLSSSKLVDWTHWMSTPLILASATVLRCFAHQATLKSKRESWTSLSLTRRRGRRLLLRMDSLICNNTCSISRTVKQPRSDQVRTSTSHIKEGKYSSTPYKVRLKIKVEKVKQVWMYKFQSLLSIDYTIIITLLNKKE